MVKPLVVVIALIATAFVIRGITTAQAAQLRDQRAHTMRDIEEIAAALESHASVRNTYAFGIAAGDGPSIDGANLEGMRRFTAAALRHELEPKYTRALPLRDAWGHPFDVALAEGKYVIRSRGEDGIADGDNYRPGSVTNAREDLVFSSGSFVRYP
jgi:hypothetical protein